MQLAKVLQRFTRLLVFGLERSDRRRPLGFLRGRDECSFLALDQVTAFHCVRQNFNGLAKNETWRHMHLAQPAVSPQVSGPLLQGKRPTNTPSKSYNHGKRLIKALWFAIRAEKT